VRDALATLIVKSLLAVVEDDAGHQRYRTLETIRAYAVDRMAEHGERQALASRHARYYCELPKRLTAQYRFEFPRSVVTALEPEIDNVREALNWAFAEGDPQFAAEIAAWSGVAFWHVAAFAEAVRWCDRALALQSSVPAAVEARLWLSLSDNLFNLGSMHRSLEAARNAAALYKRSRDSEYQSAALNCVSHTLFQLGEIAEARAAAEKSVSIARSLADDLLIGRALRMAAATSGPAVAREYMREAFARYRAAEQQSGLEVLLMAFAEACFADGDVRTALFYGHEAVEVAAKNSHRARFAGALNNVAAYSLADRDVAGAREAARRALNTVRDIGESMNTMYALQHAGTIFCRDGAADVGARLLGASDRLYTGFGIVREFTERTLYESTIAALRESLGERALQANLADGRALTIEQAIELALGA